MCGEHAWMPKFAAQAARRARPLRRRPERIARPARVRMRRRKPWVLCRRRLFGWKVRLLNVLTPLGWDQVWSARDQPWTGGAASTFGCARERAALIDPVSTCQRYVVASMGVNLRAQSVSSEYPAKQGRC